MQEKILSTLNIHKLTEAQYNKEVSNGNADEYALYLTPDEEIDLSPYATIEDMNKKANSSDLTSHTGNKSNPHSVTKEQVGLGNVPNVTTNDQTPTYSDTTTFATLTSGEKLNVAFAKIKLAISRLITHIDNSENPHNVTKSQVGLGSVDNTSDANKPVSTAQNTAINNALSSAKSYTDTKVSSLPTSTTVDNKIGTHNTSTTAHSDIRELITALTSKLNNFLDVDDETTDQLSEVLTLINNNKGTLESLTTSKINVSDIVNNLTTNSTGKVLSASVGVTIKGLIDALQAELDSHTHAIADVTGLQSALDGKAASSHGTHVSYSTTAPVMDGTANVGTASTVARSDHKHPTDTSRAAKTDLDSHTSNTTVHVTATERTNWNSAKTHADSAHAPSNAEKNQNAFSNVKVGTTTVAADSATDTLELVAGTNVTLTPDATNDKVTITAKDTVYTHPNSGVTAGTYKSVTVNAQGHVTGGSNPTTLSGYGITDAAAKSHSHDDMYYTESEIDSKVSALNSSISSKMDLTSAQTASGVKTFSNGINVGSANLKYDADAGALVISFS